MGGRLCGMLAFCLAAGLLMGKAGCGHKVNINSSSGSKFGASRASWDEEESNTTTTINSAGAGTKGGFMGAVVALCVRVTRDVLVPFLDACRILLMDLKTPYRRGDAYFLTAEEAPRYGGLSSEEKAIEDVSNAAKRVAEGTRRGVKRAGDALRTLMDGFT